MIFKSRCYNGGKRHFFEAMYSEQENKTSPRLKEIPGHVMMTESLSSVLESSRRLAVLNVYVCSVCRWCGAKS